jgi:hypothetical protein
LKSGCKYSPEDLEVTVKPTARFIVTNGLEVHQSTLANIIRYLKIIKDDVHTISDPEPIVVTPKHVQGILGRALLGSERILSDTFPSQG